MTSSIKVPFLLFLYLDQTVVDTIERPEYCIDHRGLYFTFTRN